MVKLTPFSALCVTSVCSKARLSRWGEVYIDNWVPLRVLRKPLIFNIDASFVAMNVVERSAYYRKQH